MLFVDTEKLIDFLAKHKITFGQFIFCYLHYTKDFDSIYKYVNEVRPWTSEEIRDLEKRKMMRNLNQGESDDFSDMYVIEDWFLKEIFIGTEQAGRELWDEYPPFFSMDGRRVPARSCNYDVLIKTYIRRIKNRKDIHENIMKVLRQAKKEDRISMGIEKWVSSAQWEALLLEDAPKEKVNTSHEI